MSASSTVVAIDESHWERVRDLRLQMLADTPLAYLEALEDARRHGEAEWRARARRCEGPLSTGLAAVDTATGTWIGTMGAFAPPGWSAVLVGVYVAPTHRGRAAGVADALLDGIEGWARGTGSPELRLEVHEDNARAQAFYRRRGYVPTGTTTPYLLDPSRCELGMARPLR